MQDALRPATGTVYAWLAPEALEAIMSKRSALAAALNIGARSREEALSAAVRTVVDVSCGGGPVARTRQHWRALTFMMLIRHVPVCACSTCPAGR